MQGCAEGGEWGDDRESKKKIYFFSYSKATNTCCMDLILWNSFFVNTTVDFTDFKYLFFTHSSILEFGRGESN